MWLPLAVMGPVFALGSAKTVVGIERGRPVLFLVLLLGVLAACTALLVRRACVSRAGSAALRRCRDRYEEFRDGVVGGRTVSDEAAWACALFGIPALGHELKVLRSYVSNHETGCAASGGGAGCAAADGGSGCSGCGGCGGCGGD